VLDLWPDEELRIEYGMSLEVSMPHAEEPVSAYIQYHRQECHKDEKGNTCLHQTWRPVLVTVFRDVSSFSA